MFFSGFRSLLYVGYAGSDLSRWIFLDLSKRLEEELLLSDAETVGACFSAPADRLHITARMEATIWK